MKTLLLHYWLVNHRGGEKVLDVFHELFPEADILTHVYDATSFGRRFPEGLIRRTFVNSLPLASRFYRHYLLLMPAALWMMDVSEYDFLLSSESGPVKGVRKRPDAFHVCYCHTPMRYIWDAYDDYRRHAGLISRAAMSLTRNYLCDYDLKSAEQVDLFIANSNFVAGRILRIYGRQSTVIHPPVDTAFFSCLPRDCQDFYLYAGELCFYKRPDIVVAAFMRNRKPLVIAGGGTELASLRRVAAGCPNIIFSGRVDDMTLRDLYRRCRALIFPGIEDFGIVPVEAQAAGAPVLALGYGGALETVLPGKTGMFFQEQSVDSLLAAIEEFETLAFDPAVISNHAGKFSRDCFIRRISGFLAEETPLGKNGMVPFGSGQ